MKKLIISFAVVLSACNTNNNSVTPTNNNGNNSNPPNTITLTIDGQQYKVTGASRAFSNRPEEWPIVVGSPYKTTDYSVINFETGPTTGMVDFRFNASANHGPLNGLGTYRLGGTLEEKFSGGQAYEFDYDSCSVDVTQNDNNTLKGTMTIKAHNSGGSKTITGTFNITDFKM